MLFKFIQNKLFVFFLFYLHTALSLLLFSFSDCNKTLDTLSSLLFAVYSFNRCMLLLPGPFSFFFLPGTGYYFPFQFIYLVPSILSFSFSVYLPATMHHFPFQFIYLVPGTIFLFSLFTIYYVSFSFSGYLPLVLGIIFLFSLFT